ncbi:hypothetical protein [Algirhabdus cladophorae]|uniref:hypothetical protein n=1 Tax=Algirhabdus cladophorae TaxID=3377108 RepID=UPI003B8487EB
MSGSFSDAELALYLEGGAPRDLAAQITQAVAVDPAVASRLDTLKSQGDALQQAFGPLMSKGVVEIAQSEDYKRVKKTHSRIMAGLCAAFIAGIALGYWLGAG